jgi:hypothetical protein
VQDLVEDSVIRDVEPGMTIGFPHDVFFEWSLFQLARGRGASWLDLVKDAGEPAARSQAFEDASPRFLRLRLIIFER